MSRNPSAIRAERPQELAKPNRTYAKDRVCKEPGCQSRISMYNRNDRCWLHLGLKVPRVRGRKLGASAAG
jgi:hypothetical protein